MKEIRITVRCLNSPTAHSKVVRVKARLGRRKAEAAVTDSTPVEISAEQQPFDDWPRTAQPTEVLSKLKNNGSLNVSSPKTKLPTSWPWFSQTLLTKYTTTATSSLK